LTLKSKCDVCGLDFSFADAGDGPAIFVIMIAGAIVVGAALLTGHSYIVYGPLALAASSVVYEGLPTYPDAGRPWRIAEELDINIFHTSPTAIRSLRRAGPDEPLKYNHHFKHMTTVGEPIEPAVWKWYYEVVGKGEAIIVDTWWQTENGGFLCSTVPALHPMKPGSAGPGVPGIHPIIYDEAGNEILPRSGLFTP